MEIGKQKKLLTALVWGMVLVTLFGMAFSLVVVTQDRGFPYYDTETVAEIGFQMLGFSSRFITSGYAWGMVVIGILCWFQMLFCLASLIWLITKLGKPGFLGGVNILICILSTVFTFLYMVEGIVYASITDATYNADATTLAYIPFILCVIGLIAYIAGVQNLNKKSEKEENRMADEQGMIYKLNGGMTKILRVYEDRVTLEAMKNIRSFLTKNFWGGTKEIYYTDMIGVQFKEGGTIVAGYIQFETANSHGKDNFNSENSFTFDSRISNDYAREVAEFVRGKVREAKRGGQAAPIVAQKSTAEELKEFKELLDAGAITQEEYDAQKAKLLGR